MSGNIFTLILISDRLFLEKNKESVHFAVRGLWKFLAELD